MTSDGKKRLTMLTRARYDRVAPFYDLMEALMERLAFARWRKELWSMVGGQRLLEVGVGTGKNTPYYPHGVKVAAIDLSPQMLAGARRRGKGMGEKVDLYVMDVEDLAFPDDTFDTVVASFVFCSVPDPVRGLQEQGRVVRPGGRIVLLEHMRSDIPLLGCLMDFLNPLIVRLTGANINRSTLENIRRAGLEIEEERELSPAGIVKLIVAKPQ
ncbi:MAG: class I SAM-dependent methyltransferase [Anaerolineae bacterium]